MTAQRPFVLTSALLPDHRILTKVNTRDAAKANDKIMVLNQVDDLYDEALSHAISYVQLLDDGQIEIKTRFIETETGSPDASTRVKILIPSTSSLYERLGKIAGPLVPGKQTWLDFPQDQA